MLAAAIICLATVLISAWIPAKRSSKVNAIEAIRQVDDVKIKGKEIKTAKVTEKLFGFEGMMAAKNFKRNKKRYRSTVLSLFLSIVLFISATSFCSYLTDTLTDVYASHALTDIEYSTVGEDGQKENPDDILALLGSVNGVTDSLYMEYSLASFYTDWGNLDPSYVHRPYDDLAQDGSGAELSVFGFLAFVNDDTFRSICKENRLKAEDYFDPNHPTAILYNNGVERYREKEGEPEKWYSYKTLDESKLPCTLNQRSPREYEGYEFVSYVTETDGSTSLVYYPTEYIEEFWRSADENAQINESLAMKLPAEEAATKIEYVVNGVIKDTPFALSSDTPAILYPYSMESAVLDEESRSNLAYETYFAFRCENHRQAYTEMEKLLHDHGMSSYRLSDMASGQEAQKTIVTVVKVFAYGFIVLISLIAIANVFNTISTNIMLRRREFAMLKSIGLGKRGFRKMMNYECIIYGLKGIIYGLPVALLVSYAIYKVTGAAREVAFYVPWFSVVIAVGSVFIVVFATMLYATRKIKSDNPIDALKNENI